MVWDAAFHFVWNGNFLGLARLRLICAMKTLQYKSRLETQQYFPKNLMKFIRGQYYCFKCSSWLGRVAVTLKGFVKGIRPPAQFPLCLIKKCRKAPHWQHGFLQNDIDLDYLCSHPPDPSRVSQSHTQETCRATKGASHYSLSHAISSNNQRPAANSLLCKTKWKQIHDGALHNQEDTFSAWQKLVAAKIEKVRELLRCICVIAAGAFSPSRAITADVTRFVVLRADKGNILT